MNNLKTVWIVSVALFALFSHVVALGVTQYLLPDRSIDNDIEYLIVVADIPAMSKPYPIYLLKEGLARVKASHPALYQRVNRYLEQRDRSLLKSAELGVALARNDAGKTRPNSHGQTTNADYTVDAVVAKTFTPYLALSLGGEFSNHRNKEFQPNNSYLSVGGGYFQADVGYRDHWYSPGYDGSLLVSMQAPLSPSVTLSNYKPLPWWGIRYEIFYSTLEEVDGINTGTGATSGQPGLLGMQLSLQPVPWFSLALNRTLMFGGGGRENTLGDIWGGFIDPVTNDNLGNIGNELGDQIASINMAFNLNPGMPLRVYFTYAGEDTAGFSNTSLGNLAVLAGVYLPALNERASLRYEVNEWQTAWYVHHLYRYGNTNEGSVMGHWFGDERVFGHAVGGLSHSLQATYRQANDAILTATYRQLTNDSYSANDYVTGHELEVGYLYPLRENLSTGLTLYGGRSVLDEHFYLVMLSLRWL